MSFEDGEHLRKRWKVSGRNETGKYEIVTDEDEPWYICDVTRGLPGDEDGKLAAKAIVAAHNAQLTQEKYSKWIPAMNAGMTLQGASSAGMTNREILIFS